MAQITGKKLQWTFGDWHIKQTIKVIIPISQADWPNCNETQSVTNLRATLMPIVHHSKNVLKSLPFLEFPKITRSSKSNFLRATNLWHDRGKCISSPTTFCMQWLQKRWLRGVTGLVYLPVPMARWWELTLNFVKDRRVFIGRDIRYDFPFEKLVLNDVLGCFTLLLAGHLADVSCYIGPHVPSGICMEIHTKIVHKRKKKPSRGKGILRQPHIY